MLLCLPQTSKQPLEIDKDGENQSLALAVKRDEQYVNCSNPMDKKKSTTINLAFGTCDLIFCLQRKIKNKIEIYKSNWSNREKSNIAITIIDKEKNVSTKIILKLIFEISYSPTVTLEENLQENYFYLEMIFS